MQHHVHFGVRSQASEERNTGLPYVGNPKKSCLERPRLEDKWLPIVLARYQLSITPWPTPERLFCGQSSHAYYEDSKIVCIIVVTGILNAALGIDLRAKMESGMELDRKLQYQRPSPKQIFPDNSIG